jgi:hypothetical protein
MVTVEQPVACRNLSCTEPGSKPSCQLCAHSPTYWRLSPDVTARTAAEQQRNLDVIKVEER